MGVYKGSFAPPHAAGESRGLCGSRSLQGQGGAARAESDVVLAGIIRCVTGCLTSHVTGVMPIDQGYMNRKWVVKTDLGTMFVKQYHKGRYPDVKLASVEEALRRQNGLYRAGVACPRIYRSEHYPPAHLAEHASESFRKQADDIYATARAAIREMRSEPNP